MNRLLETQRNHASSKKMIKTTNNIIQDLKWFIEFARIYNATCTYIHQEVYPQHTLTLNACLSGLGGVFHNYVYHVNLEDVYKP